VAEDRQKVAPGARQAERGQRRHGHFVDQVAEEGRLGQDLDVEERGVRLERNRRQLLAPMEPARGVQVGNRHREEKSSGRTGDPARQARSVAPIAAADHVVALIDRLQERLQMSVGPGLAGGRHEHQRLGRAGKASLERSAEPARVDYLDHSLRGPAARLEQRHDAPGDRGRGVRPFGRSEHDNANRGVRQRIAMQVRLERVALVFGRGHACSGPLASDRLRNEPALDSAAVGGL
jgi:hypothetical protein